jgi:hypothetical protein
MFRLALHMGRTVGELEDALSSAEWTEWQAYAKVEPFGPEFDMFRSGVVAAAVVNKSRQPENMVLPFDFFAGIGVVKARKKTAREIAADIKRKIFGVR